MASAKILEREEERRVEREVVEIYIVTVVGDCVRPLWAPFFSQACLAEGDKDPVMEGGA